MEKEEIRAHRKGIVQYLFVEKSQEKSGYQGL
jgi:hypothetical protein